MAGIFSKIRPLQVGEKIVDANGGVNSTFSLLWQQLFGNGDTLNDGKANAGPVGSSGLAMGSGKVLGRNDALTGAIEELSISEALDLIGSAAHGDILYRDSGGWARLPAGTSGQFLKTLGAGADPAWATVAGGGGDSMLLDGEDLGIDPYATFYLDTATGSDSDDGLTGGTAWATLAYALSYISRLRWNGKQGYPSLEVADGTYDLSPLTAYEGPAPLLGSHAIYIYSASGVAADVTFDCGGDLLYLTGSLEGLYFEDITFDDLAGVYAAQGAAPWFEACAFNVTGTGRRVFTAKSAATIVLLGATAVNFASGTQDALFSADGGKILSSAAFTLTGSPAWSIGCAVAENIGLINANYNGTTSFSGTATGPRYYLVEAGFVVTGGGGASYFPGNSAGSKDTTSFYDEGAGSGGYTDEQAQDAVGGILVDSDSIDFTYSDATPSITAKLKIHGCRLYKSGNQSITAGAGLVDITFDSEKFDTGGFHSTSSNTERITFSAAGYADVAGGIEFASAADQVVGNIGHYNSSNTLLSLVGQDTDTTGQDFVSLSLGLIEVASGDYIKMQATVSTNTRNVNGGATVGTFLSMRFHPT